MLRFYNTLSRQKDELKPINKEWVGLYTCGPTVYNFAHIGNLRTYIFEDILERTLRYNGHEVRRVMNITDVGHLTGDTDAGDDKLDREAQAQKKSVEEIAQFYTDAFFADLEKLNVIKPDIIAPATKFIREQIAVIETLFARGFAYDTPNAVYFDVSKFKDYGKLSGQSLEEKLVGARGEVVVDTEKHNAADFALWFKLTGKFKEHLLHWPSPWGEGFPGWHIECSAISRHFLGQPFDIHTGGVDHIGTHHENEIAQSEAAFGVPLANIWMHGEHLNLNPGLTLTDINFICTCGHINILKTLADVTQRNEGNATTLWVTCKNCGKESPLGIKMSKSAGNFITLSDLEEKGYHPLMFRYLTLGAHYHTKLNFNWESLDAAKNALERIYGGVNNLAEATNHSQRTIKKIRTENKDESQSLEKLDMDFKEAINNDLNIPEAVVILRKVIFEDYGNPAARLILIKKFDKVLGLGLAEVIDSYSYEKDQKVAEKMEQYKQLRSNKQFIQSDALRKEIEALGFSVRDTESGSYIVKKFFK